MISQQNSVSGAFPCTASTAVGGSRSADPRQRRAGPTALLRRTGTPGSLSTTGARDTRSPQGPRMPRGSAGARLSAGQGCRGDENVPEDRGSLLSPDCSG